MQLLWFIFAMLLLIAAKLTAHKLSLAAELLHMCAKPTMVWCMQLVGQWGLDYIATLAS